MSKIKDWCYRHRKGLTIAGTVLAAVGLGTVICLFGKENEIPVSLPENVIPELPETTTTAAKTVAINVDGVIKTFPREMFIRQLHDGWKASPEKLAEAAELGIALNPGETLVDACTVNMKVVA